MMRKRSWLFLIALAFYMVSACEKIAVVEETVEIEELTVEDDIAQKVEDMLSNMTLEEKVGQLLMPDFRKWNGENVTKLNEEIATIIRDYHIGGIILFRENFESRQQTKQLISGFQKEAEIPLLLAVDQEGGLVTRLPFFPRMPGNMAIAATGEYELAKQVGFAIGSELNRLGIHINFGPVLDINNNPDNPVIGVRSFGDDVNTVSKMGTAYMEGLNLAGVAAVGKHFPGHGDVDLDSHFVLPSSNKTIEQLNDLELKPFQSLINKDIQGIMTAHITFDQIDQTTFSSTKDGLPIGVPATMSRKMMTDILRQEMQFRGVLFTDAMDMKAVSDHFHPVEASIKAIEAGVDVVLMPTDIEQVHKGLLEAVEVGRLTEERINESVTRILEMKQSFIISPTNDQEKLLSEVEAIKVEQEVAKKSITLVHNNGILPIVENSDERIALIAFNQTTLNRLENSVKPYHWRLKPVLLQKSSNQHGRLTHQQVKDLEGVSKAIIVTTSATYEDRSTTGWQIQTIKQVIDQDIPIILVAAQNPYDIVALDHVYAFIAQYDIGVPSFNVTGKVLFGKMEAKGQLPVQLPTKDVEN
ncbi:beta-N-acetylhexosaminidase [Anaerobacillus alkaliphilus]|uniref:beta-N-acetylhexosaminidase n=1 Tax=Anaerobacillus alkaliphilus TaxID=1548597 RepID=A0A4Q0VVH9_9BACI|nr:beta-N-acetylhexosaminidase [Anaerobacillus alkaliphilus]RXJ02537.1 beta-N-acetylhexosaminidase [Anaerobacillus alkaliphilus]